MIQCQNCGQTNNYGSNFCRFCGTRMIIPQNAQPLQEETPSQPRPYMWKTDEFQVRDNPAKRTPQEIRQVQPLNQMNQQTANYPQMQNPQMQTYQRPAYLAQGYRCPRCGTQQLPHVTKKISTAGWIVFAALLVFFFPLFWIGLLIKEEIRICPVCQVRIS